MDEIYLFLLPISITVAVSAFLCFTFIRQLRAYKKLDERFYAWVNESGYRPIKLNFSKSWSIKNRVPLDKTEPIYSEITSSTFSKGLILRGFYSELEQSQNTYFVIHQTEVRGQGKNSKTFERTILGVHIPDTKLQMVINSKLCHDYQGGGDLSFFSSSNKYKLEGQFADFYDIYMPSSSQSETLSILTPDSMWYILSDLVDFDIEINGSMLYVYSYNHLPEQKIKDLITKLDRLLAEIKLRKSDVRQSNYEDALVARTATDANGENRQLTKKRGVLLVAVASLLTIGAFLLSGIYLPEYGMLLVPIILIISLLVMAFGGVKQQNLRKRYNEVIKSHQV